ncbi:beta-1,3-galactosyltransferase brn-like [Rhipicephalus microplus]|uniref:beta-1,3-galactosyltransferase brn-like n=1 Tax=Rhipicephalus microplus TaxID=6941 RepID=UPI003F6D8FB8
MDALAIWNPCPKLTVLVTSEPGLRAQRDAIRTTWGRRDRYSNCSHRVIFFMSAVPRSKQHYALKSEYLRTKDIVVQAKITASPEPSWSMSALLVEWVPTHVSHSSYVLRVTDDTYVNVSAVLAAVESLPSSDVTCLMYGHLSPDQTHLEDCAYMVKSKGFAQMQRSFADVAVNYSEGPLVTGRLAREAGLVLEHMDGFGSCRSRHSALTVRELLRKVDDAPATFLTVRGLSPVLMSMLHQVVTKLERLVLAGAQ